jgi:uncharacterized protein HemY
VRILFWFLILAAAAVGVALATRLTAGYALFVAPPFRLELSLNLFLLLLVTGFVLLYLLLRLIGARCGCPMKCARFGNASNWSACAVARMRRSSRCSKVAMARLGNTPRKRSPFRNRRGCRH